MVTSGHRALPPPTPGAIEAARAVASQVRESRDALDRDRQLPPALVDTLQRSRLFHLLAPRAYGGLEVDPQTFLFVVEELARVDASVAWVVLIGNSTFFTAFLDAAGGREICGDDPPIMGSVFAPTGRAVETGDGYRVSGLWRFGSAITHSAWMIAACTIHERDGEPPRLGEHDQPIVLCIVLPAQDYEILDTWSVGGLRGTGSHDFAVHDVLVPRQRTWLLGAPPVQSGPLYALPIPSFLTTLLAMVPLGVARGAIDTFVQLAATKKVTGGRTLVREQPMVQTQVAQAEALLRSARSFLLETMHGIWETTVDGRDVPREDRALLKLAAVHAALAATQAVDLMYHAGGGSALYTSSPLERAFRDAHAARQHIMLLPSHYESIGSLFLGQEVDPSVVF